MEIKELSENDYLESLKLSMYAFQYSVPEEQISSRLEKLKNHKILGIWDKENLAAKLHILPFGIYMKEMEWKMGGLAGVATYPEFRRSGYVKALIVNSLKRMREDKQIVSLLHPFDVSFYRKFGWEILSENKKMTIQKSNLTLLEPQPGIIKRYTKQTHNKDIENVYTVYSKHFNGMLVRDLKWWKENVYDDNHQVAVYYNQENGAKGYILYKVKERNLDVSEMAALNQEARKALWNFICQHDSMVDSVSMNLPIHDPFPYFLEQPKLKMEIVPYFMVRVVDVLECLRGFPFIHGNEALFLHIDDHFAPWNTGSYLIGENQLKVFKEKEGSRCAHPPKKGISLTINSLSAILFGYKRPVELYEMGYLKGSQKEIETLEKMVPNNKSAFFDFF